jgi:hypothetical protein
MSKDYLLLKTISVMVHKDALPKEIVNKLSAGFGKTTYKTLKK